MREDTLKQQVIDHFNLLKTKRDIEHHIRQNEAETVQALVKERHFDLLSVSWSRLKSRVTR